ncbi:hypothetical protein [Methylobacterium oryzihabitans]|uniref:Uncharacterized protein n=1 Tax=Methylobacterium oryzihabitans TaxID=2499852 RepID=A0A3S2YXQ2_9HYPH|nr:hypothetical protein [Methylobacterium oryzihabitans]RVU21842.1 hypothetical protein EOE48_01990 [Methylobacterium oryzihabitans]
MTRAGRRFGRVARSAALVLAALPAGAVAAPTLSPPPAPTVTQAPLPQVPPPQVSPPAPVPDAALSLRAVLTGEGRPIRGGLSWRIYEDRGESGRPVILARSTDAQPSFRLPPGNYLASVTYGFVSTSKRVALGPGGAAEQLTVQAGALRLAGAVGDVRIQPAQLAFSVFVPIGSNPEGRLVREGIKAGEIIRLPEGTYHVVSTWGDSNAIQRADLKVENGRITDATLNHRAATVTLKLVAAPGTEAFAGTAFSVLTPGGDTIREAIGAFPQVTLAEGEYQLIARHEGKVYTQDFKVESGVDRDIEAIAKDP